MRLWKRLKQPSRNTAIRYLALSMLKGSEPLRSLSGKAWGSMRSMVKFLYSLPGMQNPPDYSGQNLKRSALNEWIRQGIRWAIDIYGLAWR